MVKISEKIKAAEAEGKTWVAFEFYPPRTADGVANLYKRFGRMTQQSALLRRRRACGSGARRGACCTREDSDARTHPGRPADDDPAPRIPLPLADPLYADITWGAGGSTSDLTLEIAVKMKEAGLEPNMHLTW